MEGQVDFSRKHLGEGGIAKCLGNEGGILNV